MSEVCEREAAHGTIVKYVLYNCRCALCQENWDANAGSFFYGKRPEERTRKVPSAPARAHVQLMLDAGFDLTAVADGAGVCYETVLNLRDGRFDLIHRATSDAILALSPDEAVPGHLVPHIIVQRLLGEMQSSGLSRQWIYRTAGISPKFRGGFSTTRVSWDNYEKLKRVHDVLADAGLIAEGADNGAAA